MSSGGESAYSTDAFDPRRIETLDSGFERLGSRNTPYTLRVPSGVDAPEVVRRASVLHDERPEMERRRDELRQEPITLDLETWRGNESEYDVPGVDTVPPELRRRRADAAVEAAQSTYGIGSVARDVSFDDPAVRGRYFRGDGPLEVGTSTDDFPGWRLGVTLAHEVGHGIDDNVAVKTGYASARGEMFETDRQRDEAAVLSERLRGPTVDSDIPGVTDYREHPTERVADGIAAMIVEPIRSREIAPNATARFEAFYEEFFSAFDKRAERVNEAWLNR
jgi:hypothetical protein